MVRFVHERIKNGHHDYTHDTRLGMARYALSADRIEPILFRSNQHNFHETQDDG